ncbi:hypothetical protein KCU81_g273, partial [Aureobasidium melanogenum]
MSASSYQCILISNVVNSLDSLLGSDFMRDVTEVDVLVFQAGVPIGFPAVSGKQQKTCSHIATQKTPKTMSPSSLRCVASDTTRTRLRSEVEGGGPRDRPKETRRLFPDKPAIWNT